jgi:ANTAR domain
MNSQAIPLDAIWQTIRVLTRFAWNASNADGYTIAEFDGGRDEPVMRDRAGLQSAAPLKAVDSRHVASSEGATVALYPLRADEHFSGVLAFTFCGSTIATPSLVVLDRLAGAIQTVYRLPRSTARLVSKIGSLEVELAAIKISERTLGLLADPAPASESVDTVVRHVEAVLEKRPAGVVLERLLPDLEQLLDERKLVVKAKTILRERDGISEEEAYLRLRNWSRARRKRLRAVAQELIAAR